MGNNGFGAFPADPVLDFGSVGAMDGDSRGTYVFGGPDQDVSARENIGLKSAVNQGQATLDKAPILI